ncbi:SCO2524 family protein [Catenulispora sp. GP43]|uniref:SCO2524 family protein n=1 Tax=Catenulispora sp. GP43 TaxID=3156263 RepID=UPI0035157AFC
MAIFLQGARVRIEPRRQILDIWRATLRDCHGAGTWIWGGMGGSDPIADAEQLLCLFLPITRIEVFDVCDPDRVAADVAAALRPLGEPTRIPRTLVDIALEYFANHTDGDGEPRFGADGRLRVLGTDEPPSRDGQREEFALVDSFAVSVTLCLALFVFADARRGLEMQAKQREKLDELRRRASRRLTAAMTGLVRGFVVHAVGVDGDEGRSILAMLRHGARTDAALQQGLYQRFERLRIRLGQDVRLGIFDESMPDADQLFECGWTWGVSRDSRPLEDFRSRMSGEAGFAVARPWLYFTVSALDSIADLYVGRLNTLSFLDQEQCSLADALILRQSLTQKYWSGMARFDPDRWPVADIPWRTSDGQESEYFSLLVASVLIHDLADRADRAATDTDLAKAAGLISDLASRGRLTSRMADSDPAIGLHHPGVPQFLTGTQDAAGSILVLYTADYAPLVMKLALEALQLTGDVEVREALTAVAEAAMEHLAKRRLPGDGGPAELWDDVSGFPGLAGPKPDRPSWRQTEKVVEALVTAAVAIEREPLRSTPMQDHLLELLHEAERIYNRELLRSDLSGFRALTERLDEIGDLIRRARELRHRRTGTAIALTERALRLLDALEQAHEDAGRSR